MNEDRLREAYTAALDEGKVNAGGHVSPDAIAALARREGSETERLATLDHVMSCRECRAELDLLRAVEQAGAQSGAEGRARRSWYVPAAVAATLLLAVGVGRMMTKPGNDDVTRGGEGGALSLIDPATHAVAGSALTFVWRPVPGARGYALEVLDAGGTVVVAAETSDTAVSPALAAKLAPGNYNWWVRATTSDARTLRSDLRRLSLTAR